ncbi:MAG: hypothetical protein IPJ65_08765 [Archangiaceae bacterium]|nr:hypothetical protein [Archangiaceae bacterium]
MAFAVTPVNGGLAGGASVTIDGSAGDQVDPHVSGDLAAYTDLEAGGLIRYYDFLSSWTQTVPSAPGATDSLSDLEGQHIAFVRTQSGVGQCMVFDVSTLLTTAISPGTGEQPAGTAIGGDTVVFQDQNTPGGGDIMVGRLSMPAAPLTNLSNSPSDLDQKPQVAPDGHAIVWERCDLAFTCDVLKSIMTGPGWSGAESFSTVSGSDFNPDTDGTTIAWDSTRAGTVGGRDIFFAPLTGGAETQLQLAGAQANPSISQGVVAFESTAAANTDLYVYVISSNTVYQVTNTLAVNETLNDVSVLSNGDVRVVWEADDDAVPNMHNIYARTFSLPHNGGGAGGGAGGGGAGGAGGGAGGTGGGAGHGGGTGGGSDPCPPHNCNHPHHHGDHSHCGNHHWFHTCPGGHHHNDHHDCPPHCPNTPPPPSHPCGNHHSHHSGHGSGHSHNHHGGNSSGNHDDDDDDHGSSSHHLDAAPQDSAQTGCSVAGGLAPMIFAVIALALLNRRLVPAASRKKK